MQPGKMHSRHSTCDEDDERVGVLRLGGRRPVGRSHVRRRHALLPVCCLRWPRGVRCRIKRRRICCGHSNPVRRRQRLQRWAPRQLQLLVAGSCVCRCCTKAVVSRESCRCTEGACGMQWSGLRKQQYAAIVRSRRSHSPVNSQSPPQPASACRLTCMVLKCTGTLQNTHQHQGAGFRRQILHRCCV